MTSQDLRNAMNIVGKSTDEHRAFIAGIAYAAMASERGVLDQVLDEAMVISKELQPRGDVNTVEPWS